MMKLEHHVIKPNSTILYFVIFVVYIRLRCQIEAPTGAKGGGGGGGGETDIYHISSIRTHPQIQPAQTFI